MLVVQYYVGLSEFVDLKLLGKVFVITVFI